MLSTYAIISNSSKTSFIRNTVNNHESKSFPEEAKQVRSKSAYKMHKRFYDFNIDLKIMESSNAKVKDFINKIVLSPKKILGR